jgi:2-polyprenyl-3-methyl-5-hydroxy-6-metoxy-1,4-benzoquinol methylase
MTSMPDAYAEFRRLARNWEALGDTDPMFGVLSDPSRHGGRWAVDEFYETGRAHVRKLFRILDGLSVAFARGDCLDFGCGMGRLTIPLAESFDRTIGVDVARSMIGPARRHVPRGVRCEFQVNRHPDLRAFPDARFDFVHSCLVLQHVPPDIALRYVGELLRVCRPGGLVVFQLPAETRSEAVISAMHALPESGYRAGIAIASCPTALDTSSRAVLALTVTNRSPIEWRHDIPAGRHICIANHWLHMDGSTAMADDGRAYLPRTLAPGEGVAVELGVQAPSIPGSYLVDVDLVQERVCWFAERGSPTARAAITVRAAATAPVPPPLGEPPARRPSLLRRIRRRLRGGTADFEMHVVPRARVEDTIRGNGGSLLHAIDDNAAGERWLSYTYVCRRA